MEDGRTTIEHVRWYAERFGLDFPEEAVLGWVHIAALAPAARTMPVTLIAAAKDNTVKEDMPNMTICSDYGVDARAAIRGRLGDRSRPQRAGSARGAAERGILHAWRSGHHRGSRLGQA